MANPLPDDHIFQFAAAPQFGGGQPVYFAARLSGLYRSADDGRSWEPAYKNLKPGETLPTTAVALAPDFEHEPAVFAGLNSDLLCSYDSGMSWHRSQLPTPPPTISDLAVSPNYARDGTVFAGTREDGVLVSTDRGKYWAAWNFGLLDLNVLCLAPSPDFSADETVYAGTESGLFHSTNGGRAWREVPLPFDFDAVLSLALSPHFAQDNRLFVGTENNGLLISPDRGKTWAPISPITREGPVNSICLSPTASNQQAMLILLGGELLLSRNGGKTWQPWQAKQLAGRDVIAILAPNSFDKGVFAGLADGGICRL